MKKFIIFVPQYFPDTTYGGPTISTSNLALQLVKNGIYKVKIFAFNDKPNTSNHIKNNSYYNDFFKGNIVEQLIYLCKELYKEKELVIIFNSFFHFQTIFILLNLKLLNLITKKESKILIAPRGELLFRGKKISFKKKVWFKLYNYISEFYKVNLLFTSEEEANSSKKFFRNIKKSYFIIPNLPDDLGSKTKNKFDDIYFLKKFEETTNSIRIICISRISKEKGLLEFLKKLSKTNKKKKIIFTICGEVQDDKYKYINKIYLKKCLEENNTNLKIVQKSFSSRKELSNFICKNHIAFFPSKGENFCHGLSEALSCYIPSFYCNINHWDKYLKSKKNYDLNSRFYGLNKINKKTYSLKEFIRSFDYIEFKDYLEACRSARIIFEKNNIKSLASFKKELSDIVKK